MTSKSYKRRRCDYMKVHSKTPAGIRTRVVAIWKYRGTIGDLHKYYDEVYLPATNCEICDKKFETTRDKHMDHSHKTGKIRQTICNRCNSRDYWMKVLIP